MTSNNIFLFSRSLICEDLWLIRNKISLFRIVIKKNIYWFNVTGAAVLNEKIVYCGGTDGGMI